MVRCVTYGGAPGWLLRKYFSKFTSRAYLEVQYLLRKRFYKKYICCFNKANKSGPAVQPCLISIETINRCNGTCAFCPANRNNDKRPFMKMQEQLFHHVIEELKEWDYDGYLNLYVNNEPLMDIRIEDWYRYAKEQLPKAKMLLYTNGTLLSIERFQRIAPYIDTMFINDYTEKNKLSPGHVELYQYIKSKEEYREKDITFQIRYAKEILTNRAGSAPNNKREKKQTKLCIMPFTDITIFPDGKLGLCCSDALEKTCIGDINHLTLKEIWNGELYQQLRKTIGTDRSLWPFCRNCDFIDAGIRNQLMKRRIRMRKRETP